MARWYRTADGAIVPEGHPDAAFLAAADGDPVPEAARQPDGDAGSDESSDDDVDELGDDTDELGDDDEAKAEDAPPNKAGRKRANKSA